MTAYLVKWLIDIEADTPMEAALRALEIQRNPESIATYFQVCDHHGLPIELIDLNPEHG